MWNEIREKLTEPFPAEDIEWRVQRSGQKNGKPWAMVLAYVTNRAIMERLDDVVGMGSWCNDFKEAPGGGVLCGITINHEGNDITKWDGADKTQIEAVKGGLSGAMKRAAVQWGIGRYLYKLEATFAVEDSKGKHTDLIKAKNTGEKDLWFKWSPPKLPVWALPNGKQPNPVVNQNQQQPVDKPPAEPQKNVENDREQPDHALWGKLATAFDTVTDEAQEALKECDFSSLGEVQKIKDAAKLFRVINTIIDKAAA